MQSKIMRNQTCFTGAQHLGSVPDAKSHLTTSIPLVGFTPLTLFMTPLATWISSDHTRLDPLDLSLSHSNPWPKPQSEQASPASETEWPSKITWSSHDDHATTHHPCHLIGRPSSQWTWDLRAPALFSFHLFLSYSVLMLFRLLCSAHTCTCARS